MGINLTSEELLTNELFGHEKGAFTGVSAMKKGLIEMASEGTLFIDEVTEMPPAMQVKLLFPNANRLQHVSSLRLSVPYNHFLFCNLFRKTRYFSV